MRFLALLAFLSLTSTALAERPNTILVITDDQGYVTSASTETRS